MHRMLLLSLLCATGSAQPQLTPGEREYLTPLASDTWRSIAYMADGASPLPEDKATMPGYTSVSNIGLYLACVPAAEELGLLTRAEAQARVTRVIEACEKLETWQGFPHSWLQTKTLTSTDEKIVSSVDLGNYEAGLIVCRQAYPQLRARISKLIEAMNWQALYCPANGWLYGGWHTRKKAYTDWHYMFGAADSRTGRELHRDLRLHAAQDLLIVSQGRV